MQEQLGTDLKVATEEPTETCHRSGFTSMTVVTRVGTFMQVNHAVNEQLRTRVVQQAERMQALTFADLFCGAGNLSMPLLAKGLSGRAVAPNPESIRGARQRHRAGLDADAFIQGCR